jgi:acetylglutamate kinase
MTQTVPPLAVFKVGGNTGLLAGALGDLPGLLGEGRLRAVIVHGGGPSVSHLMQRLGLPVEFRGGLRVTDAAALESAVMVLRGQVNTDVVASLARLGVRAVGLSGVDAGTILAKPHENTALGLVGQAGEVRPELLNLLIEQGMVPCLAPLALDREGVLRNLNADTMCGALAGALSARWTIFLTDVSGVIRADGSIADRLSSADVEALIASGEISGGMIPKVRACLEALRHGAQAVYIADGRRRGVLTELLAEDNAVGTLITE